MDFILSILSYWNEALAFLMVLAVLIFFHELGHFLMARFLKLGVVTFSLGFGPKIWKYKPGKTTYCLSLLPFGGYLSTVGEYSDEVEALGFTEEEAVYNRPPLHRLLLAFAGPFANILLAFFIYWGLSWNLGAATVLPVVGTVMEASAAAEINIIPGDIIQSIGAVNVAEWDDVPKAMALTEGKETEITFVRDNKIFIETFIPQMNSRTNLFGEEEKAYLLGITASGESKHTPLNFFEASKEGLYQTWFIIKFTLTGISKLITGSIAADNMGGPIMIAQIVGEQANLGFIPLLLLTALISINLGLLNLLPFPILDGGTIVFSLIEMITRRPINERIQEGLMQIGACLLICLMVYVTFNDILRLF